MMTPVRVRLAESSDLGAIRDIFNHYARTSTATFQIGEESERDREAWFNAHGDAYPAVVAERDERVVGWGSLSIFNQRAGYRLTVENSVYVHPDEHRRGVGRAIMTDLLLRAEQLGYHVVIAIIAADQAPSVALHSAFGFEQVAHLHRVGYKFGRWLDVVYMQRTLTLQGSPSILQGEPAR